MIIDLMPNLFDLGRKQLNLFLVFIFLRLFLSFFLEKLFTDFGIEAVSICRILRTCGVNLRAGFLWNKLAQL